MRVLGLIACAWLSLAARPEAWRGNQWQIDFGAPKSVRSVLQIFGDHEFVFQNAPTNYTWSGSLDGTNWFSLVTVTNETRIIRKLSWPDKQIRFARFQVTGVEAVVQRFEFDPSATVEWIVVVNATHDPKLPGEGKEFIPLARAAEKSSMAAQQIWLDRFNPEFLGIEPRPLCAFVSGSFKDWCEVDRNAFRGMSEVLSLGNTPIWASCGGAQALAIIAEHGVDKPWDCPHCRDAANPKTPIYTHIGHTSAKPCGDYSGCIFERGPHKVAIIKDDPVFKDLSEVFVVMESHCGQIAYMPKGWEWLAGPGEGTLTKSQAFRRIDRPIYAAQFHIEMAGATESSEIIMRNFLSLARGWRARP